MRTRFSGGMDRTTLAIIAAAVTLVGAIAFPRVYPAARSGPTCSDLASPLGGNNRSVLAYKSENPNALDLDVKLDKQEFRVDEPLKIQLTFVNKDKGPVILNLNREGPILTANDTVQGITFEFTRVGGGAAIADQPRTYQPPESFADREQLHLLGSRARCSQRYSFTPTDLAAIGIGAGEYRVRAFYRNSSDGDLRPVQPVDATATPIPEYIDNQGVWVGEATSAEVRFSIVVPGQPSG